MIHFIPENEDQQDEFLDLLTSELILCGLDPISRMESYTNIY